MTCSIFRHILQYIISTHTPAWGVTLVVKSDQVVHANFNSHARVGRDLGVALFSTMPPDFNSHARVGRDGRASTAAISAGNFNSHARVGRDLGIPTKTVTPYISTHTPAWGVTLDVVSKGHEIITRADYPMQNHTISHKIFLFYFFPLRSAPEF